MPVDTLHFYADAKLDSSLEKAYLETEKGISLEQIIQTSDGWQLWSNKLQPTPGKTQWIHFFVENLDPGNSKLFFANTSIDLIRFHVIIDSQIKTKTIGEMVPGYQLSGEQYIGYDTFDLPYGKVAEVFVEIPPVEGYFPFIKWLPKNTAYPRFSVGKTEQMMTSLAHYYSHNINELQIRNLYQGALILMTIICLFFLIRNRGNQLFLFYFLYVLAGLFYSLFQSRGYTYVGQFFQLIPALYKFGGELFFWAGLGAYFGFAAELMNIQTASLKTYRFIRKIMVALFITGLLIFTFLITHNNNAAFDWIKIYTRIPVLIFYVGFLIHLARNYRQNALLKYILIGNGLLIFFACIAWVKDIFDLMYWPGPLDHLFTLPFAMLLEIGVFAFAMAQKQKEDQEKVLKTEKAILETEMLALRSQMNPHFVFNSLNSIRNLVMKDQNEKAIDYLSRFSKLVRTILQQTQKKTINLDEELETLQLYIQSESDRLDTPLDFTIDIEKGLDLSEISFPPMLLQPVAENAIWHGLQTSKQKTKVIHVAVKRVDQNHLRIIISDNGIGRKANEKLKSEQNNSRISMGSEITAKRLQLFNEQGGARIEMSYNDLPNGQGTQVFFDYFLTTVFQ
ncbi:hypothetical protein AFM12_12735 [Jiulongibacter sediminis]|uniref:Signal transduction histidine kinase internal region domain-containing protein n=2 Tax=Jiulongibacter sediminis TaxID=1605367 RepID=A0A0P7BTT9_9BACT|nr:hypothetical protein AFM12_12735 [Jiulongibacter sediminis]TBX24236.1 hypothetical protein TK44_12745 [Jiulongibacter sediminis]